MNVDPNLAQQVGKHTEYACALLLGRGHPASAPGRILGKDKHWRILTRLRTDPAKATTLLRVLLVLTRQHTTR